MADEARINAVVSDIVDGVRAALFKHDVTFEEYRVALAFLLDAFEKNDVPLLMDVFFNTTIVKIEGKLMGGSKPSLEGPYYLENAAVVTDRLPMRDEDKIGRESGRERVCQYVWISGVAVSLKKKK